MGGEVTRRRGLHDFLRAVGRGELGRGARCRFADDEVR